MSKQVTCTLYVSGMHCAACELVIERKIKKMPGVSSVNASLKDRQVDITGHVDVEILNEEFSELGYSFNTNPVGQTQFNFKNLFTAVIVLIFLTVIYLVIEDTKILARFSVTQSSSLPAFFILGIVAGLSSCAALVGGLILSLSKQWQSLYGGKETNRRFIPFVMFNIGRLISFALLGAALGFIGSFFTISLSFMSIFVSAVSLIIIILGLQMLGVPWFKRFNFALPRAITGFVSDEKNFSGKYMPFISGALTFFLPCGFTLMAQSIALATGKPISSMLIMTAFALGTLPVLAFLSYSSLKFQTHEMYAQAFNLIVAIFIIVFGVYNFNASLNVLGVASLSDLSFVAKSTNSSSSFGESGVKTINENGKEFQEVNLEARGFEYLPKEITLKVGIPVKFKVNNNGAYGCAQAMYLPGLYDKVVYLTEKVTEVEFTPEKKGNYKISCTMGMVPPVTVRVI